MHGSNSSVVAMAPDGAARTSAPRGRRGDAHPPDRVVDVPGTHGRVLTLVRGHDVPVSGVSSGLRRAGGGLAGS